MFENLVGQYPNLQRKCKIHSLLLSRLKCTPLQLSNPMGYVKIIQRNKAINHPERSFLFRSKLLSLLKIVFVMRLAIKEMLERVAEIERKNSFFLMFLLFTFKYSFLY